MVKLRIISLAPRLKGIFRRAAYGGKADSRQSRYLLTALIGIVLAWGLAIAYLTLSSKSYTSSVVLVLPGTGAGSAVNLESIGSASTTSASAYSSPDLSPTENYRKILLSHRLLTEAAEEAGEEPDRFPLPKVELADQTKLISITVAGRSPQQAVGRAEAIRVVFISVLDHLRQDELQQRDNELQSTLSGYKDRLQAERLLLIEHQAQTGLVSGEQYKSIVANVERLRQMQHETEIKLRQGRAAVAELTRLLDTTPEMATGAMVLRSDPVFQALLETQAKQEAEIATLQGIHGGTNPRLIDAQAEHDAVQSRLATRGMQLSGLKRAEVLKLRDISLREERATLFGRLVGEVVDTNAQAAVLKEITEQLAAEQARVLRLAPDASKLENLARDVQVAEAVFSSALARTDTAKADYFSSYPMVQTFEPPLLPTKPSSPMPALAIGGGIGATFLILAALVLSWLRIALLRKILKRS